MRSLFPPARFRSRIAQWLSDRRQTAEEQFEARAKRQLAPIEGSSLLADSLKASLLSVLPEHQRELPELESGLRRLIRTVVSLIVVYGLFEIVLDYSVYASLLQAVALTVVLPSYQVLWVNLMLPLETVLVREMSVLLARIEEHQNKWASPTVRRDLIRRLEKIARLVQKRFPGDLGKLDIESGARLRAEGTRIARSIRAKKIWVAMPKRDTPRHLSNAIGEQLYFVATRNWDRLAEIAREQLRLEGYPESVNDVPKRWISMIVQTIVMLTLIGLAVGSIALAVGGSDRVSTLAKNLVVPIVALALFQLLALAFGDKAPSLKDIAGVLPGVKKGGG